MFVSINQRLDAEAITIIGIPFGQMCVDTFVGDRDVRTPASHARNFYNGVKDKVPARFELIADMPHSMPWYPSHYRATLPLMADFLTKDCGPGGL